MSEMSIVEDSGSVEESNTVEIDESFRETPEKDPYKTEQITFSNLGKSDPDLEGVDWSFRGAQTDYLTHGLQRYPARMIPQIPRTLLNYWLDTGVLTEGDTVFDPFSGSGTTATECRLNGLNAIATDINPYACFLSRGKCNPPDFDELWALANRFLSHDWTVRERFIEDNYEGNKKRYTTRFKTDIYDEDGNKPNESPAYITEGWVPDPQVYKIESAKRFLNELRSEYSYKSIRIARLALGETAREISYQQSGEFKRQRISDYAEKKGEPDKNSHNPSFLDTFIENLYESILRVDAYLNHVDKTTSAEIIHGDCRDRSILEPNSVDATLCSPPYGDSRTTVAYGQFSQLQAVASTAFDLDEMKSVDPNGLGGRYSEADLTIEQVMAWSDTLEQAVLTIREKKKGRDDDVLSFMTDYAETLLAMKRVVKPGQPIALVVGNRTVSGTKIPLNLITTEMGLHIGLEHVETHPREIPSKTIPYANSPSNIPGQKGETIADENLIIFNA